MTRTFTITLSTTALLLFGSMVPVQGIPYGPPSIYADPLPQEGVVVYQFHRRFRCEECFKLEKMIGVTLENHFPKELKSGSLIFKVVNLDVEENKHYETDYDFFYNTVIIVDRKNGRNVQYKNIEEIWQMTDDEQAVINLITSTIRPYLDEK